MADFASRLKKLRKEKKLRQKDLADKLDLAQTTIANYEQGIRFPNQKVLVKIANYFNISLDYLLARTDNKKNIGKLSTEVTINNNSLSPLAEKYLNRLLAGKEHSAYQLIQKTIADGVKIEEIYLNVFEPSLRTIGDLWEKNKVTVAQEHYFSTATESIMSKICPRINSDAQKNYSLLSLSANGEFHNIGIRMITDLLSLEGWETYYLGSNLPTHSLITTLQNLDIDLIAISATMSYNIEAVENLITAIRSTLPKSKAKIIVGGYTFNQNPKLWKEIGADGFSSNAKESVELATKLVSK
ncbi:helix-turn-helix domain-containing protein [Natroniella sulfidigena]|uniref:cobalamin-dependent protein n=1 Tax=Natroniella sulfidigena TaxID=723921 RepID=UPI00200B35DB|nr:cobalamin-dependent protein [Natroniella sulfidigena]MCK8818192.1 helix-turn-helix domain-containing protein [Natroniella sulfidigena]